MLEDHAQTADVSF
jgi:Ras-related protein Rab-7A